jgi:6-phosphofructokinase 1
MRFREAILSPFEGGGSMSRTIGIVTGGGDCPGLNAVIRAVAKAAFYQGFRTVGIEDGFEGLLRPHRTQSLDYKNLDRLLKRGGTILGTANRGRFSAKIGHGESIRLPTDLLEETKEGFAELGLTGLVAVGGDGSMSIAQQLFGFGLPVVGVPKTIDNDLSGTLMTFGFDSAVTCAVDAVDRLQTTAESHDRVMVLEVMGRYAGWIAIYAGVAGGADVILIPEIPFTWESVCGKVEARRAAGKEFTIIVVAEGARLSGGEYVGEDAGAGEAKLGGIGQLVAEEVSRRTGKETRAVVLGHLQRGGTPTMMDRVLCTLYGTKAVELIATGRFGRMVAWTDEGIRSIPLTQAIGRLKTVPLDSGLVRSSRDLGICLGD